MMRGALLAGVASACVLAPCLAWAQPVPREAPVSGRIVARKAGETMVLVRSSQARSAEVRQDLKAGDVLRTNASGTLAIVFADRTQIRLARNTVLRVNAVQRGAPSSVSLQSGQVWGRTPRGGGSNLSVETPAATAGIRGTEWSVSVDGDTTALQVFSGEVEFANPQGSLSITGGQAARAIVGAAPTRVAIVDPTGREQMVYFIALEDGLDLFAGETVPGLAEARRGEWQAARAAFAGVAPGTRERGIADLGDYIAAVELGEARPVPEIVPGDALSYARRAYVLSFVGELEAAIATADAGLAIAPDEPVLYEIKARAALLLGDEARARQAVDAALARNPDDAAALALRSEIALHYAGDPYRAVEDAARAVELRPERVGSYRALGEVRLERGGEREALAAIDAALDRTPNSAALHAQRAQILLDQKRMRAAKAELDRALELDPSLSIVRTGVADYELLQGRPQAALEEALAASADNPSYARVLLELAEIYYRLGDTKTAIQQLDAADRLDADDPLTPLARAAIALHRFDADGAILGANEALDRFRARGGVYSNLSENRETGSIVSQSFRFLKLEGWGRYYGDRVFDTFTPSSYFDQALNQTPGPFFVRDEDGNFNASSAEDFDQISSFLQGVALDPLSVANSERLLQFDNGSFFEGQLGGSYLHEDLRDRQGAIGKINGITLAPFPIGFGVDAKYNDVNDMRGRPDLGIIPLLGLDSRNIGNSEKEVEAYVGFEPGAYDQIAFELAYNEQKRRARTTVDLGPGRDPLSFQRDDNTQKTTFAFGLWGHEFGYRNRSTLAAGIGSIDNSNVDDLSIEDVGVFDGIVPAARGKTTIDFKYVSANYLRGIDRLDLRAGVEFADYRIKIDRFIYNSQDPDNPATQLRIDRGINYRELRGYADARWQLTDRIIAQGQINVTDLTGDAIEEGQNLGGIHYTNVDWRLGAAVEPAAGHWLRFATTLDTKTLFPFTFRPVNVIGLKGNTFPSNDVFRSRSHMIRWDAQWSRHFFTALSLQDQRHQGVQYTVPDSTIDVEGGPVRLQRIELEANWWLRGNFGLRASYAYTHSEIRGIFNTGAKTVGSFLSTGACTTQETTQTACRFRQGDPLPYVPRHAGRASAVWTLPAPLRIKAEVGANYIGGQNDFLGRKLKDFIVADARIDWEPFDRRFAFAVQALNLFDENYGSANTIPAPRRTIIVSGKVRF